MMPLREMQQERGQFVGCCCGIEKGSAELEVVMSGEFRFVIMAEAVFLITLHMPH